MAVRVVSAACGSLMTALVLTPLDVTKTRMQIATTANLHVVSDITTSQWRSPSRTPSTITTLVSIARIEGVMALWSGFAPSMMLALPSAVMYYTAYDELRDRLRAASAPGSLVFGLSPMLAGMGGRTVTALVSAPLELLRTRSMMLQPAGGESAFKTLRREAAVAGPAALWRGLTPTLWRDVPFSGIYWLAYERFKAALSLSVLATAGPSHSLHPHKGTRSTLSFGESFAVSFVAGSCAGALAATITTPFDVVKTLAQASIAIPTTTSPTAALAEPSVSAACGCANGVHVALLSTCSFKGAAASSAASSCTAAATGGTFALLGLVLRAKGPSGLFAGLTVRVAKVAPACAIMISSYEAGKRLFALPSLE